MHFYVLPWSSEIQKGLHIRTVKNIMQKYNETYRLQDSNEIQCSCYY